MDTMITLKFNVTPSQKETIDLRMAENGFDDISAYAKVMALKVQSFNITSAGAGIGTPSVEISFDVTEQQKANIEENMTKSECNHLETYLAYIAMHGVISATIEVRSTGNLDSMLERIMKSKNK